jgi:hypothetical protein
MLKKVNGKSDNQAPEFRSLNLSGKENGADQVVAPNRGGKRKFERCRKKKL